MVGRRGGTRGLQGVGGRTPPRVYLAGADAGVG